jgi:hypothetical protein
VARVKVIDFHCYQFIGPRDNVTALAVDTRQAHAS